MALIHTVDLMLQVTSHVLIGSEAGTCASTVPFLLSFIDQSKWDAHLLREGTIKSDFKASRHRMDKYSWPFCNLPYSVNILLVPGTAPKKLR